jgi:mannan endo-1,6-alpha-mannosidase
MLDYVFLTSDHQWDEDIRDIILYNVYPSKTFQYPPGYAGDLSYEDRIGQCSWGLAAMQAAEQNFPNPAKREPQWLALAQDVFNRLREEWLDLNICRGVHGGFSSDDRGLPRFKFFT